MSAANRIPWRLIIPWLSGAAFVALAVSYITPLSDIDTWWHLATGRYLVEHGAFLTHDPLGLAGADITPGREIILNGYWLSQLVMFWLFKAFGPAGLIGLRVVLLSVPSAAVLLYGARNASRPASFLLALLCGWAMVEVSGIRPNHLTVALTPILAMLLCATGFASEMRQGEAYKTRLAWLLPPLVLVWANVHGGFLLGVVLVLIYVSGETVTHFRSRQGLGPVRPLWGVAVATVLASALNPNGFLPYLQYLQYQGGIIQQRSSENLTPLALAKSGVLIYWPYWLMLLFVVLLVVAVRRSLSSTRVLLLAALAALSLTAFRYAPLFVGAAAILTLRPLQAWIAKGAGREKLAMALTTLLASGIVLLAIAWYPSRCGALRDGPVDRTRFPVAAVDYLERTSLEGVVFNYFSWGGYLEWRRPQILTPFIDGRSLNMPFFHSYTRALWLPNETQEIFDRNHVDVVLVPRLNPVSGELYALTDFLWGAPQWVLVYRDSAAMVLVRKDRFPKVELDSIGKSTIYRDVLADIDLLSLSVANPANLTKAGQTAAFRLATSPRQL